MVFDGIKILLFSLPKKFFKKIKKNACIIPVAYVKLLSRLKKGRCRLGKSVLSVWAENGSLSSESGDRRREESRPGGRWKISETIKRIEGDCDVCVVGRRPRQFCCSFFRYKPWCCPKANRLTVAIRRKRFQVLPQRDRPDVRHISNPKSEWVYRFR